MSKNDTYVNDYIDRRMDSEPGRVDRLLKDITGAGPVETARVAGQAAPPFGDHEPNETANDDAAGDKYAFNHRAPSTEDQ